MMPAGRSVDLTGDKAAASVTSVQSPAGVLDLGGNTVLAGGRREPRGRASWRSPALLLGIVFTACCVALAIASIFLRHAAYSQNVLDRLRPPDFRFGAGHHFLGTDSLGRDVTARIMTSMRISLEIATTAVIIAGIGGVLVGVLAGYFGGWLDDLLMRTTDAVLAIPIVLLALSVLMVAGSSVRNLILVISFAQWMVYARTARGETLQLRERTHVLAAKSLGAGHREILVRNIVPHLLPSALVLGTLNVSAAILMEAALSFLGLGVQPPDPSLGSMLSEGRQYIQRAPWMAIYPGIALLLVVFAVNLLGDGLRHIVDPASRRSVR